MKSWLIGVLTATMGCGSAIAGTYSGMAKPYFYSDALYIDISATQMAGRPACATRNIVILQEPDYTSPSFKAKFAILLSSWLADKPVVLTGTGACSGQGDEIILAVSPE